jgi:hypothetical protein
VCISSYSLFGGCDRVLRIWHCPMDGWRPMYQDVTVQKVGTLGSGFGISRGYA